MWSFLSAYWPGVIVVEALVIVWAVRRPMLPRKILVVRTDPGCQAAAGRPRKYWYWRFRFLPAGVTVRVRLLDGSSRPVNVRLMDGWNFRRFKKMKRYSYIGGCVNDTSPIDLRVPRRGRWYVELDLGGVPGKIKSDYEIVTGPLRPSLPNSGSLADIVENVRQSHEAARGEEEFDVFISYAHKDGGEVAHQLSVHLRARKIDVWIDELNLNSIGQSISTEIDRGIARSRFAALILTPAFFEQAWTRRELAGCVARHIAGKQHLLPVPHNITMEQVLDHSPTLVDRLSRSTGQYSISEIAAEIARVVRQTPVAPEQAAGGPAETGEHETGP
jgi:hypothetical protein